MKMFDRSFIIYKRDNLITAIAPNKTLVVARLAGIAPSNAAGSGD
jgi:hypothetical protein